MYNSIVKLYTTAYIKDTETGIFTETKTERKVYAEVESVSRSEFNAAGMQGIAPEYRITMPAVNYNGEKRCSYNGVDYAVYRSYQRYSEIELYVQREAGVTNG